MSIDYLLHESSVGYAIFQVIHQPDTVGNRLKEVQDAVQDLAKFGKMVKLVSFAPFQGAAQALENANEVSEGIASEFLLSLLEVNLPKAGKKNKVTLGVSDKSLAGAIKGAFPGLECETGDTSEVIKHHYTMHRNQNKLYITFWGGATNAEITQVQDMLRGVRQHAHKLLVQLQEGDVERAQLGLGHAYSRARVKFSVQKNDNHIIQAIATLDHLDKAINMFSMRVREWYSWHFPELIRIVSENHQYAKLALWIGDKERLTDNDRDDLAAQVNEDAEIAQSIIDVAKVSMGQKISESDMDNVTTFARKVVSLANYRKTLYGYLVAKMGIVAPNLGALIGEVVGARLISHAGSLTSLSKYPASTVQILGAEKALFRALKTKGNTPKYGLIYHSSFIGKAGQKNKGRISRFLANKCSIASRIDNFSEEPTTRFGEALKAQVEERLKFYDSGAAPTKNELAMRNAMDKVLGDMNVEDPTAVVDSDDEMADVAPRAAQKQEKQKKDKKDKKEAKKASEIKEVADGQKKKKRKHSDVNGADEVKEKKPKKAQL